MSGDAQRQRVPELGAVAYEAAENAPLRAEIERLRERLAQVTASEAVTRAEVEDLRQRLDERNRQLDALTREVIEFGPGSLVAAAHAARKAAGMTVIDGYPVRDDLSHLATEA